MSMTNGQKVQEQYAELSEFLKTIEASINEKKELSAGRAASRDRQGDFRITRQPDSQDGGAVS
jgi:hypothetical protein